MGKLCGCGVLLCSLFVTVTCGFYKLSDELIQETLYYKKQFELHPTSNRARFDFAMVCAYTGDIERGLSVLKILTPSYATDVLNDYLELAAQDDREWRYPFKLAFGHYFNKDYGLAIESFERVLTIDPEHLWAMAVISFIYGKKGDLDEALFWAKKAYEIQPDAAALHFILAAGYKQKGRYFRAARYFVSCAKYRAQEEKFRRSFYE